LRPPKARESDYVETRDGLFFAVKGLVHPPEKVVAYLRYVLSTSGEREKRGRRYRRMYDFAEQERLLRRKYPQYLFSDPVFGQVLQGVPHRYIKRIYNPRLRLRDLKEGSLLDLAEREALAFAQLLQEEAEVTWSSLGVSGSLSIEPLQPIRISILSSPGHGIVGRSMIPLEN
jgi:predicted nucleotidyltransferase